MNPSWRMPEEIEKTFRKALDHASQRQVSELHTMLDQMTAEQLESAVGLCALASAYTAINTVSRRWPTDAGLRRMAQKVAESENLDEQYGVTEQNLYRWLSECALGFKAYAEIFDDIFDDPHEFMAAPFFFTINLLAGFSPEGKSVTEFLNQIETAYERAWLLDLNLLPALMVRARMPQPEKTPGTDTASN